MNMEAQKKMSAQISITNAKDNWMEVQYTKILTSLIGASDFLNLLEEDDPSKKTSATGGGKQSPQCFCEGFVTSQNF